MSRPTLVPAGMSRWTFASGWGLLALGEVAHGSLAIETEIEQATLALRAAGYAFLVLSLMGKSKGATNQAAVVVTPAAFMPAVLSLAAAGLSLRSGLREGRRLALSFVLFGGSEVVFALGGAVPASEPGLAWYVAHGLRIGAGAAVAAWMWQAMRTSIQIRFVAAFVGILLLVVILITSVMTQIFTRNVRADALQDASLEGESQELVMRQQARESLQDAKQVAGVAEIRRAVAERDPVLAELGRGLQEPGGLFEESDFLAFFARTPEGPVILAYSAQAGEGEPPILDEVDATSLAGTEVVASAVQGIEAGSADVLGPAKVALIGAVPVLNPPGVDPPGQPLGISGVIALGRVVEDSYLAELSRQSGLEFSLVTRDRVLASTLPSTQEIVRDDLQQVFEAGRSVARDVSIEGTGYFSAYVPLERADGAVVAALVVSERSEVIQLTQQNLGRVLFLLVVAAAALAIGLSYVSGSRITGPILELTRVSRRIREGNLQEKADISSSDEIGVLGAAFNEMTSSISQLNDDLRRAAEDEFQLRSRLETILQSMADGVVAVDAGGKVVAFNREAEKLFQIKSTSAHGRDVSSIVKVVDGSGSAVDLPLYSLSRGNVGGIFTGSSNGAGTPVAITSAPINDDDGHVVGAVGVVRDLSSELEVERMKTEFLSNISHELRTPLTPIKGYTELMIRRNVPRKKAVQFLDTMMRSVERLQRIVDMLIDVSSMEAGRLVARRDEVDLQKVAEELIAKWRPLAKKHKFQAKGFRRLPIVHLDERLLPRALDELIDNAIKFSPKGGKITIAAEMRPGDGGASDLVDLSVSDEGSGITDEQLAEIFGDFYQVDASATREFGGLGIGLAYVRRIAEAHGGRIEASSRAGAGSRISILVPLSVVGPKAKRAVRAKRVVPATAESVARARRTKAGSRSAQTKKSPSSRKARKPISKKKKR